MEKKKKKIYLNCDIDFYDLEGTIEEIYNLLLDKANENPDYKNFTFKKSKYDCSLEMYGERLETDEEYNERLLEEEKKKTKEKQAKERRRKKYEELKKEFG